MTTATATPDYPSPLVGKAYVPSSGAHKHHVIDVTEEYGTDFPGGADKFQVRCRQDGNAWIASGPSIQKLVVAHPYIDDDMPLLMALRQRWGNKRTANQTRVRNALLRWKLKDKTVTGAEVPKMKRPATVGALRKLLSRPPEEDGEQHILAKYVEGIGDGSVEELRNWFGESYE